jgi:hypothetical protein
MSFTEVISGCSMLVGEDLDRISSAICCSTSVAASDLLSFSSAFSFSFCSLFFSSDLSLFWALKKALKTLISYFFCSLAFSASKYFLVSAAIENVNK